MIQKIINNNYVFVVSVLFLAWFVTSDNFSRISGNLMPVVTELSISNIDDYSVDDLPAMRISGDSLKLRNCDFLAMEWHVMEDGISGTAKSFFLDPPQGRPSGKIEFTGIIVNIDRDRLNVARSTVTHRCALGLKVITKWYGY